MIKCHIKCVNCDKMSRYESECCSESSAAKAKLTRPEEEEHALLLLATIQTLKLILMNEVRMKPQLLVEGEDTSNTNTWYFDNDASRHMSKE